MDRFISQIGFCKEYLIFFILFCCMFTIDNVFSRRHWQKSYSVVTYNQKDKTITFVLIFYDYWQAQNDYNYLEWGNFSYSMDGCKFVHLMSVISRNQMGMERVQIIMRDKKCGEKIQILSRYKHAKTTIWPDGETLTFNVKVTNGEYGVLPDRLITQIAIMSVKWDLSISKKPIKYIRFRGFWISNNSKGGDIINEVYPLDKLKRIQ